MVDEIMGYTVLAHTVALPDKTHTVALAFCAPADRLNHEWSRKRGLDICKERAENPRTRLIPREEFDVRDYVLAAIGLEHAYVPDRITRHVIKAARHALHQKVAIGRKRPMAPKMWNFYADFGRMGSLSGIFTATEAEVQASYGKMAYFGEVLGKHSNIRLTLTEDNFVEVGVPETFVRQYVKTIRGSGFNPLQVIADHEDERAA